VSRKVSETIERFDGPRIAVRGARTHNLKALDVDLPRHRLIVVTGPSGSGKSSLAFDTLHAEGQRRYVESLSAAARQMLAQLPPPQADLIEGLSPTIAIAQRFGPALPRSTVGTLTEILDYLRLLYARVGEVYSHETGERMHRHSVTDMVDAVLALGEGAKFSVLAPVVVDAPGDHAERLAELRRAGYARVAIDGRPWELEEPVSLDPDARHTIEVYVDRLKVKDGMRARLADSLETAVALGGGRVDIEPTDGARMRFSDRFTDFGTGLVYPALTPASFSFNSPYGACPTCGGAGLRGGEEADDAPTPCPECDGTGLRIEARMVRVGGQTITGLCAMPLPTLAEWIARLSLAGNAGEVAAVVFGQIERRIAYLIEVGLGYLTLDRRATTLSGGELQRIRLAAQVGAALVGVTYILDEPSVGLHARDNARLIAVMERLRDLGNTVVVVEHDQSTMRAADWLIDMGPGAGAYGGEVVAAGSPRFVAKTQASRTAEVLAGTASMRASEKRGPTPAALVLEGATGHNLKGDRLVFPVARFTCVSGVSGSGKSSAVIGTLLPEARRTLNGAQTRPLPHERLTGLSQLDKVIHVDQAPIGRTARSNAATFTGLFAEIRALFAALPEARMRGYSPARFSFNDKSGRCEVCQGEGVRRVEMVFLPDVLVTCDRCGGARYNPETLGVRWRGKTIAEVLGLSVNEAYDLFAAQPSLRAKLEVLRDVGLGYIALGQHGSTLSGGEAQRIKLARELARKATGRTLYVFDEPTSGLHFGDVEQLLAVFARLVDEGNTVIVIEHNLEVIAAADHVIDLGPEGGNAGGSVVAMGTPAEIMATAASYTGQALAAAALRARAGIS